MNVIQLRGLDLLNRYKKKIDLEISSYLKKQNQESPLFESIQYALTNSGKRIRPLIVLLIGEAFNAVEKLIPTALGVEFFHTASLLADDLPCMDDEINRRDKLTVHQKFNESTAILASYALISAGYEQIIENASILTNPSILKEVLKVVVKASGIDGAPSGQLLDLSPPDQLLKTIETIIYQKTITLFEISFVAGWLFLTEDLSKVEMIRKCSYHLGMAFQIADDFHDKDEDIRNNIVNILGEEKAKRQFSHHMNGLENCLQEIGFWTSSFQSLCMLLRSFY